MTQYHPNNKTSRRAITAALAATLLMLTAPLAHAQAVYPTPEAAAQAFTDAIASNDETALAKVLGKNHARYVPTDSIGEQDIYQYLGAWAQGHRLVEDERPLNGHPSAHIEAGTSSWTVPIPLVKAGNGWRFDMAAARDELQTRRIGRNERSVMQVALAYVDAQNDYHKLMKHYGQRFVSTPGTHDGLYWDTAPGDPDSPLGPLAAAMPNKATATGGFYGYHYRILTAQGPHAKGGAKNYMQNGELTGGFGMIAWPAKYGETGVMSFMTDQDGQIYEKNLGPKSAAVASAIKSFDPDSSWKPVTP
ncbi:putative exported protein [Candidatus Paraburkholderia schumanniana]|nr:putative exported protein [Candidatus Paraburkholderia schumannianae]